MHPPRAAGPVVERRNLEVVGAAPAHALILRRFREVPFYLSCTFLEQAVQQVRMTSIHLVALAVLARVVDDPDTYAPQRAPRTNTLLIQSSIHQSDSSGG